MDEIAVDGRTHLVLMDNNILASDYGLSQIEKIAEKKYRVDFNQALDARLVTDEVAKLLSKVHWLTEIRFGCDTKKQIEYCVEAMRMIDAYRCRPAHYLMYAMLHGSIDECYNRLTYFKSFPRVRLVTQPYRDFNDPHQVIPQWQRDMARWSMRREFYAIMDFKEFAPRKDFVCSKYFE